MEKKSIHISIRVIILFTIAIFSTFVPELYRPFFGDWFCEGAIRDDTWHLIGCQYTDWGTHDSTWHWGYRHWLYLMMCLSLFIIQVVQIIKIVEKY